MSDRELRRQLDLITRGTVEVIQQRELEDRVRASLKEGRPLRVKGRVRSHRTRPSPWPHRADPEAASFSGTWA